MYLGRVGVWSSQLRGAPSDQVVDVARELEELGYGALWLPGRGAGIFERVREVLDATSRVVVATGIVSIWTHPAAEVEAETTRLNHSHPSRFLVGLGVSHARAVDPHATARYSKPLTRMREYLDELDAGPNPVPNQSRVLAALGPRMLALARDRSAGAHPYLVTPAHTRLAREILGPDRLLAPEQAVILETEPDRARALARQHLAPYLLLTNYTENWLRLGFTAEDLARGGSDRLVDAIVSWGGVEAIRERIDEHHSAGADHVCLQVLIPYPQLPPRPEWRILARSLFSG